MRRIFGIFVLIGAVLPCGPTAAHLTARADIIGNWEEDPRTCEGDGHVTYSADGAFDGYDFEGRWLLSGNRLATTITQRTIGPDEKVVRIKSPESQVSTIVSSSRTRRVERWQDGSLHRLHRCP